MVSIDITAIAPYIISLFCFFILSFIGIGLYYIRKIESELRDQRDDAESRRIDFYGKYEEIQRTSTEIKLVVEHIKTEHDLLSCKREV